MKYLKKFILVFLFMALLFPAPALQSREEQGKKVLTIEDYQQWRRIIATSICDDGSWVTFAYQKLKTDDLLYVKNLLTDKVIEIPRGSRPQFSDNSKWLACFISLPFEEMEKLRQEKKPIPEKVQLMNLETGEKFTCENAASFIFSKGSKFFAVQKTKSDPASKHSGADLILRDLGKSLEEHIGSVGEFSFNKPGTLIAYTIDAADKAGNGVYLISLDSGVHKSLDNGEAEYVRLSWDEEGNSLALLKGIKKEGFQEKDNILLAFTGLVGREPSKIEYNPAGDPNFPKEMVISERMAPQMGRGEAIERRALFWSDDHSKIFCGIKEQEKEAEKKDKAEPASDVDIFHWKDDRIQTVQKAQAEVDRNSSYRSVLNLKDKRFVRLADRNMRRIAITKDGKWGIGEDDMAYLSDWKERRADYYRVNATSGERKLMFKEQGLVLGLSPDSKNFLYWKDGHVWVYKIGTGEIKNLTESAPQSFVNKEYDYPGTKPPYGMAGFTKDGAAVILNHRYDLWLQPLDGSQAKSLTGGLGDREEIRFRYLRLDPEERNIDLSRPILLSAYGEWTKKEGCYEWKNGKLNKLIYEDKHFENLLKAKNASKVIYTWETFADFPDYYASDMAFSSTKRVTDANPWKPEYKWGHRILFDFENKNGVRLQGTLAIPDDYKTGERLPMIVNFYEKKSQELHKFYTPMFFYPPQYTLGYPAGNIGPVLEFVAYVSNGYLVMQPDVHFNTGTTHDDMLDCVEAATKKVIEMGYADPDHIGLCGGSFSGGGSAFISTRSKMFAAVASRAAPINLVGEFNVLFRGSGQNNHSYDIYGQGRYGNNPYDDFELYRSQSPITHVRTMDTPLLLIHGTEDGSVEYLQAMEFYNGLRFNGKPVIFLSYPGEGHNLQRFENQKDLCGRLWQFFDHHLKGKPAPEWMKSGLPFLKKQK